MGIFGGSCTPKKTQHFTKNFLHFFFKTLGIRSFHSENFRFCPNFYKITCKIFRRKSAHFCPRKSSLIPLAGDPGNPCKHRGGRTPKIGQNWSNFPLKKSRIFLENFHIFYYVIFVKIHVLQQISTRKNSEKQCTFFDTFFPKFVHFCARSPPGKSPIFNR